MRRDIIAILDIDSENTPPITKEFLSRAEKDGRVILTGDDLPKSVIICDRGDGEPWAIFSQISAKSLAGRAEVKEY